MAHFRLVACLIVLTLAAAPSGAQTGSAALQKEIEGIRAIERMLNQVIETKGLQEEMPLTKFLDELVRRAQPKKLTIRIDREAFGKAHDRVAGGVVHVPAVPMRMTLGTALRLALSNMDEEQEPTCRIDPTAVTITKAGRAYGVMHTASYDIRDLVAKPGRRDGAVQAQRVVKALIDSCDWLAERDAAGEPAIQIRNGNQLVVRATALRHTQMADVLAALRRAADVAVIVRAQLYEVDEAFYMRLKKARRQSLEELEKQFLAGEAPKDDLFKLLATEKPIQSGEEIRTDDGAPITLLSRQNVIALLPEPLQLQRRDDSRQIILEGATFVGVVNVSADRRSVRLKFSEHAAKLEEIRKVKMPWLGSQPDAEIAFVKETTVTQVLEIPDGGSILVPVQYRPAALEAKKRWWVLSITPRIWIEEEEQQIRRGALESILPLVVADVLNNPRLKSTREFYGSPGDKRFALVKNDVAAWPSRSARGLRGASGNA